MAKAIMIQGTGSYVGKSMLVTGLCRLLYRQGKSVAPFKAQNMALNAFVTPEGGEIGYAQAVQAEACEIPPTVHMNPVLLKPDAGKGMQVVVRGKARGHMSVSEMNAFQDEIYKIICDSYFKLSNAFDYIVIEGAGSPAEINLRETDLANMRIAEMARSPVLLVSDVDRGGAFAAVVGTLSLLSPEERRWIQGFVFNKFRGEVQHFQKGFPELERLTGKKVLGVIPFHDHLVLPDEDGVGLEEIGRIKREPQNVPFNGVRIGVVHVPHISNSTDFDSLKRVPQVSLEFISGGNDLSSFDLVIIPGSKNPIDDLIYLWESGMAKAIQRFAKSGGEVAGICGGYQMLGHFIKDPFFVENRKEEVIGLGLLDVDTVLEKEKTTQQIQVHPQDRGVWPGEMKLTGYEIHTGVTHRRKGIRPLFVMVDRGGKKMEQEEGAVSPDGKIWGTYLHGLFDNDSFRDWYLNRKRREKGIPEETDRISFSRRRMDDYDRIAELVKNHVDLSFIDQMF